MSVELKLVMELEKYECLYNYNLAEYSHKDIREKAWAKIAAKTKLSVNECKEKWRNVRSSFLRSMKPRLCGSKIKKPYYLKEYLHFILPYIKPISNAENSGDIPELIDFEATDSTDSAGATSFSLNEELLNIDDIKNESVDPASPTTEQPTTLCPHRRKRPAPDEDSLIDYFKSNGERYQTEDVPNQLSRNESMRYFLLSLLPEFETMTDNEIRTFKIKVMMLINDMKSNPSQQNSSAF